MSNAIADAVIVEDVNFDNIPDIVATGNGGSQLTIYLGKGDGTFEKTFKLGEPSKLKKKKPRVGTTINKRSQLH